MPKIVAPNVFATGGQIDPRRWNENVEALRRRELDLLSRRVSRFQLPFVISMNGSVTDTSTDDGRVTFSLPYDCVIEGVTLVSSATASGGSPSDTTVTSVATLVVGGVSQYTISAEMDNAGTVVNATESLPTPVSSGTTVILSFDVTTDYTAWSLANTTCIVHVVTDSMAGVSALLTSLSDVDINTSISHTEANALFVNHAANMDELGNNYDEGSGPRSFFSILHNFGPTGSTPQVTRRHYIENSPANDFVITGYDMYAVCENSCDVGLYFSSTDTGAVGSVHNTAASGAPHTETQSGSGLSIVAGDQTLSQLYTHQNTYGVNPGAVLRGWHLVHCYSRRA